MGWYTYTKKWLKAGLVISACLGYLALIHIGSPNATYRFYIEVSYMPLTIFVMVPFVFDILPKFNMKSVILFLSLIFCFRLAVIAINHKPFSKRIEWVETKIEEGRSTLGGQLFVMQNTPAIEKEVIISWGVAYESVLLSIMQNPENPTCLLMLQQDGRFKDELSNSKYLLTTFKSFPFENRDAFYFG